MFVQFLTSTCLNSSAPRGDRSQSLLKERPRFLGRRPTLAPTVQPFSSVPRGKSLTVFAERASTVLGSGPHACTNCAAVYHEGNRPQPLLKERLLDFLSGYQEGAERNCTPPWLDGTRRTYLYPSLAWRHAPNGFVPQPSTGAMEIQLPSERTLAGFPTSAVGEFLAPRLIEHALLGFLTWASAGIPRAPFGMHNWEFSLCTLMQKSVTSRVRRTRQKDAHV